MTTFYEDEPDEVFRFGDVVRGFASSTPIIRDLLLDVNSVQYKIDVCSSSYCAVLSPCCSIGNEVLALVPLQHISQSLFKNPWLVDDFTRLNRKMSAENSVPPHVWKIMTQNVKEKNFDLDEDAYAFNDFFLYAANPLLPTYTVDIKGGGNQKTGCYMIDFKNAFRINCERIRRNKEHPVEGKVLQLTIDTRGALRDKIAAYFARVPEEDQI